ncbi:Two-pore potassium channel 3 [Hondaea fermentalgiana]|uniref:Two-pore potassium channel 3 n=1 Tax=Hondaea fermentalgiana TaxID=2315210 RepID=A0A2R5G338_9STRA|nr:Two-pore potassium channel 3 [Hondaea fermentalgiana]|eukprot:GBG24945.1 Two-pore potassium channel 3 [Hondaea fermentalgiana]
MHLANSHGAGSTVVPLPAAPFIKNDENALDRAIGSHANDDRPAHLAEPGRPIDFAQKKRATVTVLEDASRQVESSSRSIWITLAALFLHVILALLIGQLLEDWSALESAYFGVVTLTTVGYGDFAPKTPGGRFFTSFYILYGVGVLGWTISTLTVAIAHRLEKLRKRSRQSTSRIPYVAKLGFGVGFVFLFGITYFCAVEGMTFIDSFYFTVVTLTTVGYGDVRLTSRRGLIFLVIYLAFGTVAMAKLIGDAIDAILEKERRRRREDILRRRLSVTELFQADADASGSLTEAEFIVFKFQQMGIVKPMDLRLVQNQFAALDRDGNGTVTLEEAKASTNR